ECGDETYSAVRDEVERIPDDLVLIVDPEQVIIECVQAPIDRHIAVSSKRVEEHAAMLALIVDRVRSANRCARKIKPIKARSVKDEPTQGAGWIVERISCHLPEVIYRQNLGLRAEGRINSPKLKVLKRKSARYRRWGVVTTHYVAA